MSFRFCTLIAFSLIVLGCEPAAEAPPAAEDQAATDTALPVGEGTRENPYIGRGVVQELGTGELVIDHEAILGWGMPPMPMAFPVIDDVSLEGLEVGDRVLFEIEMDGPAGYQIVGIEAIE